MPSNKVVAKKTAAKPTVVIIAGGLATRMRPLTENIPKCMVELAGKPLIEHQLEYFRDCGYTDFIFCIAHLASKVREYFGNGSQLGVAIRYSQEPDELLGTAGAAKLVERMASDPCVIYYGDTLTSMDFDALVQFHAQKRSDFTVVVHAAGKHCDSLVALGKDGRVQKFLEKPPQQAVEAYTGKKYVNSGIYVLSKKVFGKIPANEKIDFAHHVIPSLLAGKLRVFGYDASNEYYEELGNLDKYREFHKEVWARKGRVYEKSGKQNLAGSQKNVRQPDVKRGLKKAIFMDRDGVLVRNVPKLYDDLRQLQLYEASVSKAVKLAHEHGYLTIVVTNQPGVAKGFYTIGQVHKAHGKLQGLLQKEGAMLDAIYFCPHHPKKGFEGEVRELKRGCTCRKPKSGMLLRAAAEHSIDLSSSWIVGDSVVDVAAGKAAGVKTAFITGRGSTSREEKELRDAPAADLEASSAYDAVKKILAFQRGKGA